MTRGKFEPPKIAQATLRGGRSAGKSSLLGAVVAALFGPKMGNEPKPQAPASPSTDSLNEGARQYRLAQAVAEAQAKESRIAAAGRKAMQATQASRDAHSAEVIGEALDYCERPEVQAKLSEAAHDPEALARLLAGRTVAEGEMDGRYAATCPPFPPIETPSGSVPLQFRPGTDDPIDVPPGAPVVATPDWTKPLGVAPLSLKGDVQLLRSGRVGCSRCGNAADNLQTLVHGAGCTYAQLSALAGGVGHYDPDWQRKAIEASKQLAAEHRVIAHRVESEAERRTRLLAEWEAHRAAEPMAVGRVPGEPMPRTEDELIEDAWMLVGKEAAGLLARETMRKLFSMALTYCRFERANFYEEHDGNRLVASMVRSAKGMA